MDMICSAIKKSVVLLGFLAFLHVSPHVAFAQERYISRLNTISSPTVPDESMDQAQAVVGVTDLESGFTYIESGLKYMEKQAYAQAYDAFILAKERFPEQIELDFLLGVAAVNKGDAPRAITHLENVMSVAPTDRVRMELAQAYLLVGPENISRSETLLNEVLSNSPPPEVANSINTVLANISTRNTLAASTIPSFLTPPGHSFSGRITQGLVYDSNPGVSPISDTISTIIGDMTLDPASKAKSDMFATTQTYFSHAYRFANSPFSIKTNLLAYSAFYKDRNDLNMLSTVIRSGLAYDSARFGFDILGRFGYFEQDSRSELRSWGVEANGRYTLNSAVALVSGWKYEDRTRPQNTWRNSNNNSVYFGPLFAFGGGRHFISLIGSAEWERADDNVYSYNKQSIDVRYELSLPKSITPYVGYRYSHSRYGDEEWFFGKTRSDNEHEVKIGVKKVWWRSCDMKRSIDTDAYYTYYRNHSNIELFDYKRHIIGLEASFNF